MRHVIELLGCLTAGAVLVAGVICLGRSAGNRPPGEHQNMASWLRMLRDEQRRSDELNARLADQLWREAAKERIAREVIAGRLTLGAAAARFQALDEQALDFNWDAFRETVPGPTDEARYCRLVLVMVRALLHDRPREAEIITRPLEAELRRLEGDSGASSVEPDC